jgi:hypothetical protein
MRRDKDNIKIDLREIVFEQMYLFELAHNKGSNGGCLNSTVDMKVYPKVSGLAAWSEISEWYSCH